MCFEQELLRAHQKSGTSYPPLNFCSVLTERLQYNQFPTSFNSIPNIRPKSQSSEENDLSQHERLLSGYVADVWDKYHRLSVMLAGRHRTEVESLWMTQIQQWKERTKEVGMCMYWVRICGVLIIGSVIIFMARRAIPMIAFHGVESI